MQVLAVTVEPMLYEQFLIWSDSKGMFPAISIIMTERGRPTR